MLSIVPGALITLNKGINEEDNEIYSPNLHFFSNKFYAKKKKKENYVAFIAQKQTY